MAKARIVYEVDDKQLDALQKQLNEIKGQNKDVSEGFKESGKEIKKSSGALSDLKGTIAGLGLAALAFEGAKEFAKLTQEVNKNRKEVALLSGETGKALDNITAKLRATSSTFGKDFNEVLRAANTLSKEFGVSMNESISTINEGFLRGLDINGDYIHTLQEYSTFIKEAGINQQDFNVLIQKQLTQGIYSDKGIDAIKEAVISIREMTPATQQAIKSIGINTNELIKDIISGTKTYFDAVTEIATKTQELADPTKTGAILADVFRGAGEDAGKFIFTLGDVKDGYQELSVEQERYIGKQRSLLETSENLNTELVNFSTNFSSATTNLQIFANTIGTGALRALNAFLGSFISLTAELDNFQSAIKTLEIDQLEAEIKKLEEGPSIIEQIGAALGGGAAGLAEQATESAAKVQLLRQRIEELKIEEEADKQKKLNEQLAEEQRRRDALAATIKKQNEADAKKRIAEEEKLSKERSEHVKELEKELLQDEFENKRAIQEEFAQEQIDDETELNNQLYEINKARLDKIEEAEKEAAERRKELIFSAVDGLVNIYQGFADLRIQQIDQEIQANELARNRELELAEGNAERQDEINKKFDTEQSKLKAKQVNAEKQKQLFSAIVNTARAVVEALPNIPLSVIVGALGAAQIGLIAAQPIPKFAKGVLSLQGPGTSTSDSIPALLSKGESVIPTQETNDYYPALKAIKNREIAPEILNNLIRQTDRQPIIINDYDKLAKAILDKPEKNIIADENGFTGHMISKAEYIRLKQNRYKM